MMQSEAVNRLNRQRGILIIRCRGFGSPNALAIAWRIAKSSASDAEASTDTEGASVQD
jgi:hypothetical protein